MTKVTDEDLRDGYDAIQGDMARHQRITGQEVTPHANARLAAVEFQQLENAGAFKVPEEPAAPGPDVRTMPRGNLLGEPTRETRDVDGREYQVLRDDGGAGTHVDGMSIPERALMIKALKRLHFLLTLEDTGILGAPSWKTRAVAVCAHMQKDPARYHMELEELLEASNKYFGDWRRDADRRIQVDSAGV